MTWEVLTHGRDLRKDLPFAAGAEAIQPRASSCPLAPRRGGAAAGSWHRGSAARYHGSAFRAFRGCFDLSFLFTSKSFCCTQPAWPRRAFKRAFVLAEAKRRRARRRLLNWLLFPNRWQCLSLVVSQKFKNISLKIAAPHS